MKKIIIIVLSIALGLGLIACSNPNTTNPANNEGKVEEQVNISNNANELAIANHEEIKLMTMEEALNKLGLEEQPKTLTAVSLAAARLAYKLELPLVAIPDTIAKEINELSSLITVGNAHSPNYEQIVIANADLALFEYMFKDSINDIINEQNVPAYFINCNYFDNVMKEIEALGVAFGKEEKAIEILEDYKLRQEKTIEITKGKQSPKVMILFGSPQSYMVGSEKTFVGDLVNKLGGTNITSLMGLDSSSSTNGFLPMSEESAVAANPDFILCLGHGSEEMQKLFEENFTNNPLWSSTNAIKDKKIVYLDSKLFSTNGGIHAIDSLEELAKILYE